MMNISDSLLIEELRKKDAQSTIENIIKIRENVSPILGRISAFFTDYTTYYILLVNDSSTISLLFYLHIGGQTPASFRLAPNLAVRYGITSQWKVPSYLIRVWPGGQGHHVVHTGLLK